MNATLDIYTRLKMLQKERKELRIDYRSVKRSGSAVEIDSCYSALSAIQVEIFDLESKAKTHGLVIPIDTYGYKAALEECMNALNNQAPNMCLGFEELGEIVEHLDLSIEAPDSRHNMTRYMLRLNLALMLKQHENSNNG